MTEASDVVPLFKHLGPEFIYSARRQIMVYGHGAYIPHTPPLVDGSYASHRSRPETFPLAGMSYENDGLGREAMSTGTEKFMKWCRQNQEGGIKMRVDKGPVDKGARNVHTPFGRTNTR